MVGRCAVFVALLLVSFLFAAEAQAKLNTEGEKSSSSKGRTTKSMQGFSFAGNNIYANVISTDPKMAAIMGRDFHRVPQGVPGTPATNANTRVEHARKMAEQLPFPVNTWWSVYTQNCPGRKTKGNDRGVAMAHHQIWKAWEYEGRQNDLLGTSKHKNGTDILLIFEDDYNIAVKNVTSALQTELSNMNTDMLFLGWCYGRKNIPMCLHAYALTRQGVRKILERWDTCSNEAIDGQLRGMTWEKPPAFTWRKGKSNLKTFNFSMLLASCFMWSAALGISDLLQSYSITSLA